MKHADASRNTGRKQRGCLDLDLETRFYCKMTKKHRAHLCGFPLKIRSLNCEALVFPLMYGAVMEVIFCFLCPLALFKFLMIFALAMIVYCPDKELLAKINSRLECFM